LRPQGVSRARSLRAIDVVEQPYLVQRAVKKAFHLE
jgi:hypothetical protein